MTVIVLVLTALAWSLPLYLWRHGETRLALLALLVVGVSVVAAQITVPDLAQTGPSSAAGLTIALSIHIALTRARTAPRP